VPNSEFWAEFALHDITKPFLSSKFTSAVHSTTEVIAALAILNLPFDAYEHDVESYQAKGIEIKAKSNMIIFKKEF
jgi:hypothetical protein